MLLQIESDGGTSISVDTEKDSQPLQITERQKSADIERCVRPIPWATPPSGSETQFANDLREKYSYALKMPYTRWKLSITIVFLAILYWLMSTMGPPDILDMHFYYSAAEASRFFNELGDAQSKIYFRHELLDLLFLSSYTALSFFVMELLFPKQPKLKWVAIVPGIFDVFETVGILAVLSGAPMPVIVGWLGVATCLKWTTGLGLGLIVLSGVIARLRRRFATCVQD